MRAKKSWKLIFAVGLVAALAVSIPLMSGCTGSSTPSTEPTPSPEPGEPTPGADTRAGGRATHLHV